MFPQLLFQTLILAHRSPDLPLPSPSLHMHWPPLFQENQCDRCCLRVLSLHLQSCPSGSSPSLLLSSLKRQEALPSTQGHSFCSERVFFLFSVSLLLAKKTSYLFGTILFLSFFVHWVELALTPPQFQRGDVTNLEPIKTLQLFGHRNRSE